jgi:Dyp-type peroxidase family
MRATRHSSKLERDEIQGMLLSAYGHLPWSVNVLLRIDDAERARAWLASLVPAITLACGKHDRRGTNVAVAHCGLMKLGLQAPPHAFPVAFVDGMASPRRAQILGDTGSSAPAEWLWGSETNPVDLLLMLFAHTEEALAALLADHRAAFEPSGLSEVAALFGRRHSDGKEHFGFTDGVAQPAIRGEQSSEPARRRTDHTNDVAAGEFILGYVNEYGIASETPKVSAAADPRDVLGSGAEMRDFGRNGSYLVLRQLEQDVASFWSFLDDATRGPNGSDALARERLAAKLVGRWPSGAPLAHAPNDDEPRLANHNHFGFASDPHGLRCPIGSHIRRANPRDGFANNRPEQSVRRSNRHRILRRGRPYGPKIENVLVKDNESRGLIFICLNSDIERQFEFIQQTWLNNTTFCGLNNEVDPFVGAQSGDARMTIPKEPVRTRLKGIPRFVTTKGGGYFFLPGLRALRYLAGLTSTAGAR